MTWGEFKAAVEKAGVKDDTEIWYIDVFVRVMGKAKEGGITVSLDDKLGVSISD